MSEIRVNTFKAEDGISAPSFPNGIIVTGIVTSTVLDNTVSGDLAVTGHLFIPDNKQLKIGNTSGSPDFKIYHNAVDTYIENSTGSLRIGKSDNVRITDAADNTIIKSDGASAYLAYEGNDKLQSTNTGVTVTGQLTATSFVGDGSSLTGITQTTINNNANNRVITGSGTANTLEAESALTFDGTTLQVAAADDIRIAGGTWTGEYASGIKIQPDASNSYFQYQGNLYFRASGGANKVAITSDGDVVPGANNVSDLGSSSLRWANLYTQDLKLSNEAKKDEGGNDVDGTWGDYTIQEGESDLFLINNRNGKKYKFMLKEVD